MFIENLETRRLFAFTVADQGNGAWILTGTNFVENETIVFDTLVHSMIVQGQTYNGVFAVVVNCLDGNDVIKTSTSHQGQDPSVEINGGAGADTIDVDSDAGRVNGGPGNDTLTSLYTHEVLHGDDNKDILIGKGVGTSTFDGGRNNDEIDASQLTLVPYGDPGENRFEGIIATGGADSDKVTGSDGEDSLSGGGGVDTVKGLGGNDTLYMADLAADSVSDGGAGNDVLYGDRDDANPENLDGIDHPVSCETIYLA